MDKIIAQLRAKGYKITPQRRALIQALLDSQNFPTAQQLLELVKQTHPDVSLDTIYRNLSLLMELEMVNEISTQSGGKVFEIVTFHHHHMVCIECGKTECMAVCPLNQQLLDEAAQKGFQITGHRFELFGKCRECQKKVAAGSDKER